MNYFCIITKKRWRATFFQFLLVSSIMLCSAHPASAGVSGKYFPNVPLLNQDGKTLHFYDDVIKGKVVSINFMFTSCPDSCPLETAKLRKVQKLLGDHLGKNVHMYSISVDPARDTPAVLKAYMKKFDVGPGWQFLTGKQEDVDLIRKKFGVYAEDETELSDHQITFVLGNEKSGQWLKRTPFDLPQTIVATLLGRLQTHSLAGLSGYTTTGHAMTAARPGEDLFNTRCTACHTIGKGDKLGPDLLGVVDKRERAWLIRWLQGPDVMLAEKDPIATALFLKYNKVTMPNLRLERQHVLDLIEYLQTQSRQVAASAGVPVKATEDVAAGLTSTDVTQADKLAQKDQIQTGTTSVNDMR